MTHPNEDVEAAQETRKNNEALITRKIKAKIKALMKGLSKKAFNTFEKKLNLCQSSVKKVSFSYRKISA